MSNDSGLFRTASQLCEAGLVCCGTNWIIPEGAGPRQGTLALTGGSDDRSLALQGGAPRQANERYVPLYEAKMIHHFDHRWATYEGVDTRDVTTAEKADADFESMPRYWVPEREVADRLAAKNWNRGWLIGWRDICRATDERTVIAAAFSQVGAGNSLPLVHFRAQIDSRKIAALAGCLTSLACDFFARHKVGGTHLNYFIYQQLAVLPPQAFSEADLAFIVPPVLELT